MAAENSRVVRTLPPLSPANKQSPATKQPRKKRRPQTGGSDREAAASGDESGSPKTKKVTSPKGKQNKTPTKTGKRTPRKKTVDGNTENEESPAPGSARRKAKPKGKPNGSQASVKDGDEGPETPSGDKPKKRQVKKKAVRAAEEDEFTTTAGFVDLTGVDDDIVTSDVEVDHDDNRDTMKNMTSGANLRSQPMGRLFIEQKGGFKSKDKIKLARRLAEEQRQEEEEEPEPVNFTTIQFGISTHRVFMKFALFCHGLLAGIGFWQGIVAYVLSNYKAGYIDFLDHYQELALPVQCMFYVLLVICLVATLDRYDIARPTRKFFIRALTLQSGAIAILLYMLALLLSLSIANVDDKMWLHRTNATLWENTQETESTVDTWKVLNLLRGIFVILGWIVISLKPDTDRLVKTLETSDENIIGEPVELLQPKNSA